MKRFRTGLYPAGRLEAGAAVLAAARVADVSLVQKRVDEFARAHEAYNQSQRAVESAEGELRTRQLMLTVRNAEQDAALESLAGALCADQQPRHNPFTAFGVAAPFALRKLNFGEKARAIHILNRGVQQSPSGLSDASRRIAQMADELATKMEADLVPVEDLQAALQTARATRDVAGVAWDTALADFKLCARAARADGARGLYRALFGRSRPKTKPTPAAATPAAAPQDAEVA